jgi:hypothetical protein
MEYNSVLTRTNITSDVKISTNSESISVPHKTNTNPVDELIKDSDAGLFDYLQWHGLANEPNLLVLPSCSHYFYEPDDLKGVRTLINQKKLNLIKELNDFLNNVYNILSPKTNFIGYFSARKTEKGISLSSRMYKKFVNFLNSKFEIEIDKDDFLRLLESHGFKVMDMTEINGLTYFLTQN